LIYAQKNNIKHKFDKSIVNFPSGSDYVLSIQNSNLILEKDLYVSPFASTEDFFQSDFFMAYIDLYDENYSMFMKEVEPRILFLYNNRDLGEEDYTDGTTTIQAAKPMVAYFINSSRTFNMGFANNLIPRNSLVLFQILKGLKIVTNDFKLDRIDILNLNFFKAVYIEQFQSKFFISLISQYDYTNSDVTEVELIKLN